MEKDKLKLELLKKIIACDDAAVLTRVEEVLIEFSEVKEESDKYIKEIDPVPANHYQILEEEFRKFNEGEIKGISWVEFRKEIKSNYGF